MTNLRTQMPPEGWGRFGKPTMMTINARVRSNEAAAFALETAKTIRSKPGKPFLLVVAAILADLMRIAQKDSSRWGYRSRDANSLTDTVGSYRTILPALDGLADHGLVDHVPGYKAYGDTFGARAAYYRATDRLLEIAGRHGIVPKRWRDHFQYPPDKAVVLKEPLVLKEAKTWINGQDVRRQRPWHRFEVVT